MSSAPTRPRVSRWPVARRSTTSSRVARPRPRRPTPDARPPTTRPDADPTRHPPPARGDLLERIQAAGQIVVNVDVADAPWSSQSSDGTFHGYEVDIAKRIAKRAGCRHRVHQLSPGAGRHRRLGRPVRHRDAAPRHHRRATPGARLQRTLCVRPGAAHRHHGMPASVTLDSFANQPICAAIGSSAQDWVDGTLGLTDLPTDARHPRPTGMTITPAANEDLCLLLDGTDARGRRARVAAHGVEGHRRRCSVRSSSATRSSTRPSASPRTGVARTPRRSSPRSTPSSGTLRDDGTLTARSEVRFDGLDLSQVPGGGPIESPPQGDAPAFTRRPEAAGPVPVGGRRVRPWRPLGMNGADLDLLLVPTNTDVSNAYQLVPGPWARAPARASRVWR